MSSKSKTSKAVKITTSLAMVTTSVGAVVSPLQANAFTDIENNPHKHDIEKLLERKIISGYPDGTFKPDNPVTRGQAAKMIARLLNLNPESAKSTVFSDVDPSHEFSPYITALYEAGIINGYPDGSFKMDNNITREEMAKMIALGFNLQSTKAIPFSDVENKSIFKTFIQALFENKVTKGTSATTFSPSEYVTRAQLASFLIRAENAKDNQTIVKGTIEAATLSTITVDGKKYDLLNSAFLNNEKTRNALINSTIQFTLSNGKIDQIKVLEIKNKVSTFDGGSLSIEHLVLPTDTKKVVNATAKKVELKQMAQMASIEMIALSASDEIIIENSTIEQLIVSHNARIINNQSTVQSLNISSAREIELVGNFATVILSANTNLSGSGSILTLQIASGESFNFSALQGLTISNVLHNGTTYTWSDAVAKFGTTPGSNTGSGNNSNNLNVGNDNDNSNPPTGNGDDNDNSNPSTGDGNGDDNSNPPSGDGNGDDNSNPPSGDGDDDDNSNPPSGDGDDDDNSNPPSGDGDDDDNSNPPSGDGNGDDNSNPPTGDDTHQVGDDTVIDYTDGTITVGDTTYDVSEEQLNTIASYQEIIQDLVITTNDQGDAIIASMTMQVSNEFNGENLVGVEEIILQGDVSTIQNIDAPVLTIQSTSDTLNFTNVTANITVTGNFTEISGASGDKLSIASTNPNVTLSNIQSKEVIINDTPVTAFAPRFGVASLNGLAPLAALESVTTTMTITFTDADYSDQILSIERKDTKVDIQGKPFSQIKVTNNNTTISSNAVSGVNIAVSNNVSLLNLNANVDELTLNLENPIIITGNNKSINELKITAPTTGTNGWLDFIGVSTNKVYLNGPEINFPHPILKSYVAETFSSTLTRAAFGLYTITTQLANGDKLYYLQLKPGQSFTQDSRPANAIEYTGQFIPYADYGRVIVYKENGGTFKGYSEAVIPEHEPVSISGGVNATTKAITITTRFSGEQSPAATFKYIYAFDKNGTMQVFDTSKLTGTWTKTANGLNTYVIQAVDLNLNNGVILTIGDLYVQGQGLIPTTNLSNYISSLKTLANEAKDNPAKIYGLLKRVIQGAGSNATVPMDSSLLNIYVDKLTDPNASISTAADMARLVEEVQEEHNYAKDFVKSAADLYLTGAISTEFEYSTAGIVTNTINTNGELLFNPKAAGSTTVKVKDANNNVTLVNVTVDATLKITDFKVLAESYTSTSLLHGATDFRIVTTESGKLLLPVSFKDTFAISAKDLELHRYEVKKQSNVYTFEKLSVTPSVKEAKDYGFDNITMVETTLVGHWITGDGKLVLYPIQAGSEKAYVGDGTKKTAVYITTTNTTVTPTIVHSSNTLSLSQDLKLQAIKSIDVSPSSAPVHLYNDGVSLKAFARDTAKASYIITDTANKVALVNVVSDGEPLSVSTFEVVKKTITIPPSTTIQSISSPIVRAEGSDLYAVATGESIVTLSNGDQFNVKVLKSADNQYTMTATPVVNFKISAADLQMTNIRDIDPPNPLVTAQTYNQNQNALIELSEDATVTLTLTSSNNEKAIIHVTKSGDSYTHTVDMTTISASDLGLNDLTDVIGSSVELIPARAKVSADKKSVNVYNVETGNRTFRATDGTNSSIINVTVTPNGTGYTSIPKAVFHEISNVELADDAVVKGAAAHLKGNKLYATGLDVGKVSVPLKNGSDYVINVLKDADTGFYKFDENASIIYKRTFNKADFGLDTITSATAMDGTTTSVEVNGDLVSVSVSGDTNSRVQVNGTIGADSSAKAMIFVTRDDTNTTTPFDAKVESALNVKDLNDYDFDAVPTITWSNGTIGRIQIKNDLKANLFAYEMGDSRIDFVAGNKTLLANITVSSTHTDPLNPGENINDYLRKVELNILEDELHQKGTIISGDSVRLSEDETKVFASKVGSKTTVLLEDNSIIEYEVKITNGQYELSHTQIDQDRVNILTSTSLNLTGNLTSVNNNADIFSAIDNGNSITISSIKEGTGSIIVTDEQGKKAIVNVTVDSDLKISHTPPVNISLTAPTLLNAADQSIFRVDGNTLYAIGTGVAKVLVGNEVQEIEVKKVDNHYSIETPIVISEAVFAPTDLGFDSTAAMSIEEGFDADKFFIQNVNGKIVAYSKLTGTTTGATEVVIKAVGTDERTLIRLTDAGEANPIAYSIARETKELTGSPVIVEDATIARFKNNYLYLFKAGKTHFTENGHIHALEVVRDAVTNELKIKTETTKKLSISGTNFTLYPNATQGIVEISTDKKTLYAVGFGETKVKDGDDIYSIKVTKNADNSVLMTSTPLSSKFVSKAEVGLDTITSVSLLGGTPNVLSFTRDANSGVEIYSNGTATGEIFTVLVSDGTNKAVINVTLDAQGEISEAIVAKKEITNTGITLSVKETQQSASARGVWDGNKITIYPLATGNSTLAFENGLVNIQATSQGNALFANADLLQHTFTDEINVVTNADMLVPHSADKAFNALDVGTALITAGTKLYTVSVALNNDQYAFNVSNGVPFKELEIVAPAEYKPEGSTLTGVKVVKDEDAADNRLIIYKDGTATGVSDLLITSGTEKTIYHTTVSSETVSEIVPAVTTLSADMTDATILDGATNVRIASDKLYYLATGALTLKASDNRLITVDVKRDAVTNYFTSTPTFVQKTLKEAPTSSLTHYMYTGTTVFAKENSENETFYTANYRTTLSLTKTGNVYTLNADERKVKKFTLASLNLGSELEKVENTVQNIANAEIVGSDLVIYAGTVDGTTILTATDKSNNIVKFNVTRSDNGAVFTVTPLIAEKSVDYEALDIYDASKPITFTVHDNEIVSANSSSDGKGLNITAKKSGVTSITLKQESKVVALINVRVDENLTVRSEELALTQDLTKLLHSTATTVINETDTKQLVTGAGQYLFEDSDSATSATLVTVTRNDTTGYYTVQETTHNLSKLTTAQLGLDEISNVSITGNTVKAFINSSKDELYIFGTNNGISDVTATYNYVDPTTSSPKTDTTLIVATNGTSLVPSIASKALSTADQLSTEWSTDLVEIRDHVIYATHSGKTVAEAQLSGYKVLMNITVNRNTNQSFSINEKVVDLIVDDTATVLEGTSVYVQGTRLFAQSEGESKVKIGTNIFNVVVRQQADGLFTIQLGEQLVQQTFIATDFGMSKIGSYTIRGIAGSNVVDVKKVSETELMIYAVNPGQVELTISDGESTPKLAKLHLNVENQSGTLKLLPTHAKAELTGADQVTNLPANFRGTTTHVFATEPGHSVSFANGKLHNIKAFYEDNVLKVTATPIEKDMGYSIVVTPGDLIVTATGNKLVALKIGETTVSVGANSYRVTITADGTMKTELLVNDVIDVSAALSSIASVTVPLDGNSQPTFVKATYSGTNVTLEALSEGKEIIYVSNGTATVQVEVDVQRKTVDGVDKLVVESKLISQSYDVGVINFYPTGLNTANATIYNSPNGVAKIESNGVITVYPGATGTSHLAILGEGKKAIYELTIGADASLSFKPLSKVVTYSEFAAYPTVVDKAGNGTATPGINGLEVTFMDENPTIFLLHGENGYKTLITQLKLNGNLYEVDKQHVDVPLIENSSVTNLTENIRAYSPSVSQSILYATGTVTNGGYTANNQLYKVNTNSNLVLSKVAVETAADSAITSAELVNGTNVVQLDATTSKWKAIQEGTGIYRINNGYVSVTVSLTSSDNIVITPVPSIQGLTNPVLITTVDGLYLDGNNVYGTYTGEFYVKQNDVVYKGTLASGINRMEADILPLLGWESYASANLASESVIKIDATTDAANPKFIAVSEGSQLVEFTSESGVVRKLVVKVDANYAITIDELNSTPNLIYYTNEIDYPGGDEYIITASLNVQLSGPDPIVVVTGTDTFIENGKIHIYKGIFSTAESTFSITLPEFDPDLVLTFKISIDVNNGVTITPVTPSTGFRFDRLN